ncbi:MAG: transcriptional regulator [Christiangramia sp.]|uniref:winged helix-turn-helix domain-containing protein n=1 Tax=Christiangramia sp. TaxID=1931228 RepID=UPI003241E627
MKNIISNINKAFDHRIRLGIMSVLMVNEFADFKTLKELLGATDGNIASHTKALEKKNYIQVEKSFINRKPNTRYLATEKGKKAFREHLEALEKLLSAPKDLENKN